MINWKDDMSVGNDQLDNDHKALIRLLNTFLEATEEGEGLLVVDSIFNSLVNYTKTHFAREEQVMETCGYKDIVAHKKIHREMENTLIKLRETYVLQPDENLESATRDFLMSWLTNHILRSDMAYRETVVACKAKGQAVH